jgi:hypothetical protein
LTEESQEDREHEEHVCNCWSKERA